MLSSSKLIDQEIPTLLRARGGYPQTIDAVNLESLTVMLSDCSAARRSLSLTSRMSLEPTNVQQIGNELAIRWNDGAESYLDLEFLRRACPCAACGGEPDVLGNIMSRPGGISYAQDSFKLAGFEVVGGYALQPRWRDGHSTGI